MSIQITQIHMTSGGSRHEHIESVKWLNPSTNQAGTTDVYPTMVEWIDKKDGKAYVWDGVNRAEVGTRHPASGRPFIQTYKDKVWTDNLLALPRF